MAPGARCSGPFPELELADLAGVRHPLAGAWREGEALFLIGHGDCSTTRLTLPYFERIHRRCRRGTAWLVLQDKAEAARELQAELGLSVPIRLEPAPYALAAELRIEAVPTLVLVGRDGRIVRTSEGFDRDALEALAARLGTEGPLFAPDDHAPVFRPG
ncbi:MAG TPA: hypothetical protein VJ648_13725 [Vicinamibacteria bacterium]|nr:hypothetical protein [Vicinamibacteria bacterium]